MSSTPACPTTRWRGNPLTLKASWAMASRGLFTIRSTQSGDWRAISLTFSSTIFWLICSRSSRLIPGLRGAPEVKTTTSDPAVRS